MIVIPNPARKGSHSWDIQDEHVFLDLLPSFLGLICFRVLYYEPTTKCWTRRKQKHLSVFFFFFFNGKEAPVCLTHCHWPLSRISEGNILKGAATRRCRTSTKVSLEALPAYSLFVFRNFSDTKNVLSMQWCNHKIKNDSPRLSWRQLLWLSSQRF